MNITELCYSPNCFNLFSHSKLLKEGYDVEYSETDVKVFKGDQLIVSGPQIGGLWWVKVSNSTGNNFYRAQLSISDVAWHFKYGHPNLKYARHIAKEKLVTLPNRVNFGDFYCSSCMKGKLTEAEVPKESKSIESFTAQLPIQKLYLDSVKIGHNSIEKFVGFVLITDSGV